MFPIRDLPSAQRLAISIAQPARTSGLSILCPYSFEGPMTTTRCGSHRVRRAPMLISLSTKNRRLSNIFSKMRSVLDRDVAPCHGDAPDEASDLDVVGTDRPGAAAQLADALDPEDVRPDPRDPRAERDEELAEILDVR